MVKNKWWILCLLCAGCGAGAADDPKAPPAPPAVQVFPLAKGLLSSNLTVPGELIAYQQVDLYAKVNSFVKSLPVDIGSEVHTGEVLATMEAPELTSQLDEARARIMSARPLTWRTRRRMNASTIPARRRVPFPKTTWIRQRQRRVPIPPR